jgi:lysophospholipase L1-like esterase
MRIIVNKKQYNKILHFQQNKNKILEGVVNFIYDSILTYEKKLITETNIRKNNISKILKNTTLESITIDMFRGNLTEVNIKHLDGMLELDVTLPKNINHTELRNKIFLEMNNPTLLTEQTNLYGLNFDNLSIGDIIAINYLVDKLRKSLGYSKQQMVDKLLFIDGDNTFKNGGVLNIDINKFNDEELSTIIKELEKGNNTNYVLSVDKNGEEIKGIGIDFDNYIALSKPSDDKIVNTDDTSSTDDTPSTDDEVVDDYEHAPDNGDGSFHIPLDSCMKDILYMISTAETPGGNHSYDSVNMGKSGIRSGIVPGISKMTVKEALKHVIEKSTTKKTDIAMGRYQYVPGEIDKYLNRVGLNRNSKFSPKNQDKMASAAITEAGINKGCAKLYELIPTLWAGIPILIGPKRGQSKYKSGINSAQIKPEYYEKVLKQCGCRYNTIDKKWEKFTPKIIADDSTDFDKYLTDNGIVPVKPGQGPNKGVQFDKIPGTTDYRSGQPTLGELAWMLQNYDIKRVIRLNDSTETSKNGKIKVPTKEERKLVKAAGAEFYPKTGDFVDSHAGYVKNKGYQQTIKKVLPILEKGNTLIHCRNGADRTGYLVAKYIKDKQKWDSQKLWDYTTEYNGWCRKSEEEFNGSDPETKGGYSSYAQGFIEGVDSDKRDELCDKRKSFDFEEEDSESTTKDGEIKVLIIGDSHSADVGKNYSRKLLNKEKYDGTILAQVGKKPKWMYDELVKIKDKIKEYDYFIVMGGGNASYRATPDIAISNLDKIYKLIKQQKGSDTKIVGITPPHKRFADGNYPSNQNIADWILSQKPSQLISTLNLTNNNVQRGHFEDDRLHLNSSFHDLILRALEKQIK